MPRGSVRGRINNRIARRSIFKRAPRKEWLITEECIIHLNDEIITPRAEELPFRKRISCLHNSIEYSFVSQITSLTSPKVFELKTFPPICKQQINDQRQKLPVTCRHGRGSATPTVRELTNSVLFSVPIAGKLGLIIFCC